MDNATYQALIKVTTRTEWVAEPVDDAGDIIDPHFSSTKREALAEIAECFREYPECVYVDIARVVSRGSEAQGLTAQRYEYKTRHFRDGRATPSPASFGGTDRN